MTTRSLSLTHKGEGKCPEHYLFLYSLKTGEMLTEFIYLSILYLNKKRGFGVVTCVSTFVPILYHIYKHLSSDLNIYFKNYLYYFLYS